MRNLHIMLNDGDLKFLRPFVMFINEHFEEEEHKFMIIGEGIAEKHINSKNVFFIKKRKTDLLKILKEMNSADKIILHSLNSANVVFLLSLQPWLLKRSHWVMWGYDLYSKDIQGRNLKLWLYEKAKIHVAKNIGFLISQIEGDYRLAQKLYGAKGSYRYSFVYPSNLFKELEGGNSKAKKDNLVIQIGNSAYESNNHLEVLSKLKKYRERNIKIICPLSYGPKDYRNRIVEFGKEIFDDKFLPILDFMPINEYIELLNSVDVAIFGHKEQQALGNITTLLGLGKKVYICKDTTTGQFCIDHDLKVYSANGNYDDLFEEMDEGIKQKNIENIKTKFSEEKLVEDLKKIFDEEIS